MLDKLIRCDNICYLVVSVYLVDVAVTEQDAITGVPEWLKGGRSELASCMGDESLRQFNIFIEKYSDVEGIINQLPDSISVYELYTVNPVDLEPLFDNAFSALSHICESRIGVWSFQHACKFRASFQGFKYAINQGNFLLAASCARAMFEEMAHFHFFLDRIEISNKKAEKLVDQEASRLRKGKQPPEVWIKKFVAALLEIVERATKAIQGSDYDWKGWYGKVAEKYGITQEEIFAKIASHADVRKTHINDCLSSLEKEPGIDAKEVYDLLSEMVHPNFGSNTLVISTRKKINDVYGDVVFSSAPKNTEAAAWFFELFSRPLAQIFEIEISYIRRSQSLLTFYQNIASSSQHSKLPLK